MYICKHKRDPRSNDIAIDTGLDCFTLGVEQQSPVHQRVNEEISQERVQ